MTDLDLPPPPDVAGISLNGLGTYTIARQQNADLCRSTGTAPAEDGTAHPAYAYIATQLGMGMSVDDLCRACAFDVADGPMIVGSTMTFAAALKVDVPYSVGGEIIGLTRKRSRTLGVMDLLDYRLRLHEGNAVAVEIANTWVLPRKGL